MSDFFGLERERKILESGVRSIFTPHQPIQLRSLFFGREEEVKALIQQLNTPGQHALLFGDRGVGKSSLANITSELILSKLSGGNFWRKICDSSDYFETIFIEPLKHSGVDPSILETEYSSTKEGGAKAGFSGLGASGSIRRSERTRIEGSSGRLNSPSWVATQIKDMESLLLIDEIDALRDDSDRHKIAEVVKHLSDVSSWFKILVVGIAETGSDLTAGHPSIVRCLRETHLGRMTDDELREIIEAGENKLDLIFTPEAKRRIVKVSSGYPHFTHLLALKAAEDAIVEERKEVDVESVENATHRAVDDAEGRLKKHYYEATRSHGTDAYRRILCAAANCGSVEFRASDLRHIYAEMWGEQMYQSSLNNYFTRLVSDGDNTILRRIAKGVYRFNDPRMPSYIRIANMKDPCLEQYISAESNRRHS